MGSMTKIPFNLTLTIYSYRTISLSERYPTEGGDDVDSVSSSPGAFAAPAFHPAPRAGEIRAQRGRPLGTTTQAPSMAYNPSGKQTGPWAWRARARAMRRPEIQSLRQARDASCPRWTPCDLGPWKICRASAKGCVSRPAPQPLSAAAEPRGPSSTEKPGFSPTFFLQDLDRA